MGWGAWISYGHVSHNYPIWWVCIHLPYQGLGLEQGLHEVPWATRCVSSVCPQHLHHHLISPPNHTSNDQWTIATDSFRNGSSGQRMKCGWTRQSPCRKCRHVLENQNPETPENSIRLITTDQAMVCSHYHKYRRDVWIYKSTKFWAISESPPPTSNIEMPGLIVSHLRCP